jgi:predicted lactoylglutathione lyase
MKDLDSKFNTQYSDVMEDVWVYILTQQRPIIINSNSWSRFAKQYNQSAERKEYLISDTKCSTFLLTDLIRSAAVKAGGVLTEGAVVVCPP